MAIKKEYIIMIFIVVLLIPFSRGEIYHSANNEFTEFLNTTAYINENSTAKVFTGQDLGYAIAYPDYLYEEIFSGNVPVDWAFNDSDMVWDNNSFFVDGNYSVARANDTGAVFNYTNQINLTDFTSSIWLRGTVNAISAILGGSEIQIRTTPDCVLDGTVNASLEDTSGWLQLISGKTDDGTLQVLDVRNSTTQVCSVVKGSPSGGVGQSIFTLFDGFVFDTFTVWNGSVNNLSYNNSGLLSDSINFSDAFMRFSLNITVFDYNDSGNISNSNFSLYFVEVDELSVSDTVDSLLNVSSYASLLMYNISLYNNDSTRIDEIFITGFGVPYIINSTTDGNITQSSTIIFSVASNASNSNVTSVSINISDSAGTMVSGSPFVMNTQNDQLWTYSYAGDTIGTFNVSFLVEDEFAYVNDTDIQLQFQVSATSPGGSGGGGGGGGSTVIVIPEEVTINESFDFITDRTSKSLLLFVQSNSFRTQGLLVKNTGTQNHTYVGSCEGTVCDFITALPTIVLSVGESNAFIINISVPDTVSNGQVFSGKLFYTNEFLHVEELPFELQVRGFSALLVKYFSGWTKSTDLGVGNRVLLVPNFLIMLLAELSLFAITLLFPKSKEKETVTVVSMVLLFVFLTVILA